METRKYPGTEADVPQLINELREFFDNLDFKEVQVRNELGSVILEAKKIGKIRDITGLSYALTIKITLNSTGTDVAVGRQKWIDKILIGLLGIIFMGLIIPFMLTVTSAIGAYNQYKLTEDAWNVVDRHMARASGGNVFEQHPRKCSGCGAENSVTSRFCFNCGAKLH
jgi:hypothetical protein